MFNKLIVSIGLFAFLAAPVLANPATTTPDTAAPAAEGHEGHEAKPAKTAKAKKEKKAKKEHKGEHHEGAAPAPAEGEAH